jgi:hypothetical protein
VGQYERYLKALGELNSKLRAGDFSSDLELFKEFKKCILHCVVRCFRSLWNFNSFKLVSDLMMKFIKHEECTAALSEFLANKNIATLSAKAKIVNGIATLLKEKS